MKVILFTTLLLFSINGFAFNWVEVAEDPKGDTFYIDIDNIKKHKGLVYYWELVDYLKPLGDEVYSHLVKWKVDCGEEKRNGLTVTTYDQSMGKGKILGEWNPNKTYHPRPNTVGHSTMKFACDNAK